MGKLGRGGGVNRLLGEMYEGGHRTAKIDLASAVQTAHVYEQLLSTAGGVGVREWCQSEDGREDERV